jgi:hypothetical protein
MDDFEWRTTLGHINQDINSIVNAQLAIAAVHRELAFRARQPIEEDFVFGEAFGRRPDEARTFKVDGVAIDVKLLHRRGLQQADILGADLLYEVANVKFALVQYKMPTRGQVSRDATQLDELIEACPNSCPPYREGFWQICGSWFAVTSSAASMFLPACLAARIFGSAGSKSVRHFQRSFSASAFRDLFGRCILGGRLAASEFHELARSRLEHDRLLVSVLQRGQFEGGPSSGGPSSR